MKSLLLYWLGAMIFISAYFGATELYRPASKVETAEIASVKLSKTQADLQQAKHWLNAPAFQAAVNYAGNWQTGFVGLVGAISCATCHGERVHTVKKGEQLGLIARAYNLKGWGVLHRRNRQMIGGDPNYILPGQQLLIPSISYLVSVNPSRTSALGKGKLQTTKTGKSCGTCHEQEARTADTVDCGICHTTRQMATTATLSAQRSVRTRRAARSSYIGWIFPDQPFSWQHLNADPYGKQDPRDAINHFRYLDNSIKAAMISAIDNTPYGFYKVKRGDVFAEMAFGGVRTPTKKMRREVTVNWSPWPKNDLAKQWRIESPETGKIYYLVTPDCINWSYFVGTMPPPPEEPAKEEPPPPPPIVEAPAPPPPPPVVEAPPAPEPPPEQFSCEWDPDFEWPLYGGVSRGIHGKSMLQYGGTVVNLYPGWCRKGESNYRTGLSLSAARWDLTKSLAPSGVFEVEGHNALIGAKGEYIDPEQKVEIEARIGTQKYEYWNSTNPDGRVTSDKRRLFFGITDSHYGFSPDAPVTLLQWGVSTEQDLGGTVSKGPNVRESIYTIRGRVEGKHYGSFTPIVDVPVDYSQGPQVLATHPAVGLKYKTFAEFLVGLSYNLIDGTGDNTRGLKTFDGKASIDLDRIYRAIFGPSAVKKGLNSEPPLTEVKE